MAVFFGESSHLHEFRILRISSRWQFCNAKISTQKLTTTSVSNNLDKLQFFLEKELFFPKSVFEKFQFAKW